MNLNDELKKWQTYKYKYVKKFFNVKYEDNKTIISFRIDFTYPMQTISEKLNFIFSNDIDIEDLRAIEGLYAAFNEIDNKFYSKVQNYIEANWKNLNAEIPNLFENLDIMVFYPTLNSNEEGIQHNRTLIFVEGKSNRNGLVTNDEAVNFEIMRKNAFIKYWNILPN